MRATITREKGGYLIITVSSPYPVCSERAILSIECTLQNAVWRFLFLQVGGKGISDGMEERVSVFVRGLLEKAEALGYSTHVAFFDQNYKADDK